MFQFKQFSVRQDKTAMKIGTDGVLLGAWFPVENAKRILDIGTGTGVVALMGAQRNSTARFDAIEIDIDAYQQAKDNFELSKWSSQITIFHTSLQNYEPQHQYDVIVSNPPFYDATYLSDNQKRAQARNTISLSFSVLIKKVSVMLSKQGMFSVIIPYDQFTVFTNLATTEGFFLVKTTYVKGNANKAFKRVLLTFTLHKEALVEEELVIEIDRHVYTPEYIALTKDFYLKM